MGSVTSRVILWTPSGPCAPWGASGPATTSPGPPSPSSSSSEILQNEEGTLKKTRPRFYTIGALRPMGGIWASNNKSRTSFTLIIKFRDSPERGGHFEESPIEILQRTRFYKERDSTKNEILQRTRFSRTRRAL